jgi:hypothetical protein
MYVLPVKYQFMFQMYVISVRDREAEVIIHLLM